MFTSSTKSTRCRSCREYIRCDATICRFCGSRQNAIVNYSLVILGFVGFLSIISSATVFLLDKAVQMWARYLSGGDVQVLTFSTHRTTSILNHSAEKVILSRIYGELRDGTTLQIVLDDILDVGELEIFKTGKLLVSQNRISEIQYLNYKNLSGPVRLSSRDVRKKMMEQVNAGNYSKVGLELVNTDGAEYSHMIESLPRNQQPISVACTAQLEYRVFHGRDYAKEIPCAAILYYRRDKE